MYARLKCGVAPMQVKTCKYGLHVCLLNITADM